MCSVDSKVWGNSTICLCLWHVRKAWAENAIKKIVSPGVRAAILHELGNIMYDKSGVVGDDAVEWAKLRFMQMEGKYSHADRFMQYMYDHWVHNTEMWVVGKRNIPHAGQDTNAAIESYHGNLKAILNSSKERTDGHRVDWLIYHLVGDVVTHYWYQVQCKLYGFGRNKRQEGHVCSAPLRAHAIPDEYIVLNPDGENIAYVASVNNLPKVWTVHSPGSEWAQCDCPVAERGDICKHVVKVFKMLHPHDLLAESTLRGMGTPLKSDGNLGSGQQFNGVLSLKPLVVQYTVHFC